MVSLSYSGLSSNCEVPKWGAGTAGMASMPHARADAPSASHIKLRLQGGARLIDQVLHQAACKGLAGVLAAQQQKVGLWVLGKDGRHCRHNAVQPLVVREEAV